MFERFNEQMAALVDELEQLVRQDSWTVEEVTALEVVASKLGQVARVARRVANHAAQQQRGDAADKVFDQVMDPERRNRFDIKPERKSAIIDVKPRRER